MSETTSDQLAEIEGQAAEYTPPNGWRLLQVGETLQEGDEIVQSDDGRRYRTERAGSTVGANQRYIRPIELEPQTQPESQPVQVREGRWRTRHGDIRNIRPCEPLQGAHFVWPWTDGIMTFQDNGRHQGSQESVHDLVEYLGPIEPDKTQELPETGEESPDQLIGRISLLRRRVAQLEELVGSLRTINEAQEKAFTAANKANTDLQHRLNVVADEWAEQADTVRKLQIELDAAQQVPQAIADRFEEGWNQGTARAVETVLAWLEPIRLVDNPNLANEVLQHLPQIMRHLTGLAQD